MKRKLCTKIGSEFWDIPLSSQENALFPPHTAWYLSGRVALAALLSELCAEREVRTAALPSWCCHTMIKPFLDADLAVSFYPVYLEQGTLHQDFADCPPCDVTLVMDYFGYRRTAVFPQNTTVIYDATHSIFSGIPKGAEYIFGSLRKWAGFLTGGYAFGPSGKVLPAAVDTYAGAYTALRRWAMSEKYAYLTGKSEEKRHLRTFSEAEDLLEQGASGPAAGEDISAAHHLDTALLRQKRRDNAAVLLKYVGEWALFPNLQALDCPLFVPIRVPAEERDALRQYLVEQEIYCPVHWPVSALHRLTAQTRMIYETEVSLLCDQRYGAAEMHRIGQAVQAFLGGGTGI